jgi:hypothetical protein
MGQLLSFQIEAQFSQLHEAHQGRGLGWQRDEENQAVPPASKKRRAEPSHIYIRLARPFAALFTRGFLQNFFPVPEHIFSDT